MGKPLCNRNNFLNSKKFFLDENELFFQYYRKQNEKDFNEKLENYNEKFTYAIQSFQATIGNILDLLRILNDISFYLTST